MKRNRKSLRVASAALVCAMTATSVLPAAAAPKNEETTAPAEQTDASKDPNAYAIYPLPQNVTYPEKKEFTLDKGNVTLVAEEGVDEHTKNYAKEVLKDYGITPSESNAVQEGKTNIILGVEKTDGAADTHMEGKSITQKDAKLFEKSDAYILDADADSKTIVIEGKDTDATFHGVSTLKMMFSSFSGKKFLDAHIEDYATVPTRGYIEGFYGSWDFKERANLMEFAKDYKMNSYVYAAKGDAYHTNKWDQLYPTETLNQLKTLVEKGEETKVEFAWSVHLGSFFGSLNDTNKETQYKKLTDKLDQLIGIGVKRIDVLNDDFGGGSNETVVEIVNRLNKYVKEKGCGPVTYCMQGYNKGWGMGGPGQQGAEMTAMKGLDSDINLYWTGDDVNSPITQETVNFVKEKTNHAPDFWLNYPVNEHGTSGIYLGDITHYARDGVTGLAAFHSNPSRYAYANEVGLYQLAALVWNNTNYMANAQKIWESAFNYLQPEVRDAYFKIASNVANCPGSGRVPNGFPESEYLTEQIEEVKAILDSGEKLKDNEKVSKMLQEFKDIAGAIKEFREKCANKDLVTELDPWLKSLDDLAKAGEKSIESLLALEDNEPSLAWENLSAASKAYDTSYTYKNEAETIAKAGSKRLAPFVEKLINTAKNKLAPILDPSGETLQPTLYARLGGVERTADNNGQKMYDGKNDTAAVWNVTQKQGDYIGLDLGGVITVKDISILQGNTDEDHDIFHKARLEYSEDGKTWKTLVDNSSGEADGHSISVDNLNIKARYVRYYLVATGLGTKPDYWTHVREFTVNKKEVVKDRVYTNVETLKATPLTIDGDEIGVRNLTGITLAKGQYVGVKLKQPVVATKFTKELSKDTGLTLEYSYNALDWTDVSEADGDVGVKYLRLVNKGDTAVQTDIQNIGMTVKRLDAEPKFLSTSTAGLKEGSYDNIFDGDISSYALTSGGQVKDTYMTFDLGNTIEVHDVTAITTDGNERFYNAKIQISEDNVNWTDVATVVNDNSVFEVPYRYVRGDGKGANARYMRIYFTGANNNALKLYEIQINKNVEAGQQANEIVGNIGNNLDAVADKDISTLVSAKVKAGSYLEYRLSENTNVTQISVLQGKAGEGKLYAVTADGKTELATLDESVKVVNVTEKKPVKAIRIEWSKDEDVSLHEINMTFGESNSDDVGTYVDPIVENPGEGAYQNIAPLAEVTESGHTDGDKDNVNDQDLTTKWDSNAIKSGQGAQAQDTGDAWIYLDFGAEKQYEMNKIVVSYFNKIYPTSWVIQTSNNGTDWTDITETLTKNNDAAANPVETIDFKEPFTARYVRLYFNTLNTGAAGHGVGVKEIEIYGREAKAVDKNALSEAIQEAEGKVTSKDYTKASKENLKTAIAEAKAVVGNAGATQAQVTQANTKLQEAVKALQVKMTEQQNIGLKKPVTVSGTSNGEAKSINDGSETTKWDSDLIKGEEATAEEAWFAIDLGEQVNLIDGLKVSYFNKVYPTDYEVQVSNDNENWTTVQTLTKEHDGTPHPKDDIQFETPVSARYVKMLFKEMNSAAGGHGIGINEAEVLGRYVYENTSVQSVSANQDILEQKGNEFDAAKLPAVNGIQLTVEEMTDTIKALVPVTWNTENLDMNTAGTYALEGTLGLNGITNTDNKKANINVIVQGEATGELNYQTLDEQLAIAAEKEKEKDKYTTDSYDAFKTAYENAKNVKENATAQVAVNQATETLKNAIAGLKLKGEPEPDPQPEVDTTALQAKVDEYSKLNSDEYTKESWDAFAKVLEEAKAVLQNPDTQEMVDAALAKLNEAHGALKKPEPEIPDPQPDVDTTELQTKVDEYSNLNSDEYTKESWDAFAKVLEEANAVLSNKEATQEMVNAALDKLNKAYEALQGTEPETPDPQPGVDTTVLQAKVDEYSKLNAGDYTEASWRGFSEALKTAKAVLQNPNATQDTVDNALAALNAAYGALEKAVTPPTTDPTTPPTDPTTPEKPDQQKPDNQKPAKTGDPTSLFGIFSSMILAGGYIFGRRKKDDK